MPEHELQSKRGRLRAGVWERGWASQGRSPSAEGWRAGSGRWSWRRLDGAASAPVWPTAGAATESGMAPVDCVRVSVNGRYIAGGIFLLRRGGRCDGRSGSGTKGSGALSLIDNKVPEMGRVSADGSLGAKVRECVRVRWECGSASASAGVPKVVELRVARRVSDAIPPPGVRSNGNGHGSPDAPACTRCHAAPVRLQCELDLGEGPTCTSTARRAEARQQHLRPQTHPQLPNRPTNAKSISSSRPVRASRPVASQLHSRVSNLCVLRNLAQHHCNRTAKITLTPLAHSLAHKPPYSIRHHVCPRVQVSEPCVEGWPIQLRRPSPCARVASWATRAPISWLTRVCRGPCGVRDGRRRHHLQHADEGSGSPGSQCVHHWAQRGQD